MASTPDAGPAIALLFEDLDMGARLREALCARGARIVLEARVSEFQPQALIEHAAEVVVLDLDPNEEAALQRVVESLDPAHQRLVLNDAEAARGLAGWDAARWARHLAAKILGTEIDPPRPSDAAVVPVPAAPLPVVSASSVSVVVDADADAVADAPARTPPHAEPAMNAALGREIEALIDAAGVAESLPMPNDPLRPVADAAGLQDRLAHAQDDFDAMLAAFSADATDPLQQPMDAPPPAAAEAVAQTHVDLDAHEGIRTSALPEPGETSADMTPNPPVLIDLPAFEAPDFDLDALLAELPVPEAMPAASVAPEQHTADAADPITTAPEESITFERVPRHEALAQPAAQADLDAFSTADLDALLAEILPPAADGVEIRSTTTPVPDLPIDAAGQDPLLSMLVESEPAIVSPGLADFDPETWTPPTVSARADADPSSSADAATRVAEPSDIVDATPVSIGDSSPDLELMLDEMFGQVVPDAPAAPAADVAAPDWGLLDLDAPAATVQPASAMQSTPAAAPDFAALDGIELLPIEDAAAVSVNTNGAVRRESARGLRRVVVIGASIGGPDAVREFLGALAPGLPLLLVVVQHLDEAFFAGYAAQFERALPHAVRTASEGLSACAGDVLLVPPRARIALDPDGGVHVLPGGDERYTPSIDDTFTRVADVFGERALALVFSGMANDALQGMRRVVECGGEVWTQTRETCVVSAMVDAAAAAGLTTFSGTPQELAARLNADFAAG